MVCDAVEPAEKLKTSGFHIGPIQNWDGEGTLEIYVGDSASTQGNLLVMEPVKEGAYKRALAKRGPGLHHIAIDVPQLEDFIDGLSGSGWLLLPKSLKTISEIKTAWLARPGVPTLIEVIQTDTLSPLPCFITEISLPNISLETLKLFKVLGLHQVSAATGDDIVLKMNEKKILWSDFSSSTVKR